VPVPAVLELGAKVDQRVGVHVQPRLLPGGQRGLPAVRVAVPGVPARRLLLQRAERDVPPQVALGPRRVGLHAVRVQRRVHERDGAVGGLAVPGLSRRELLHGRWAGGGVRGQRVLAHPDGEQLELHVQPGLRRGPERAVRAVRLAQLLLRRAGGDVPGRHPGREPLVGALQLHVQRRALRGGRSVGVVISFINSAGACTCSAGRYGAAGQWAWLFHLLTRRVRALYWPSAGFRRRTRAR